MTGVRTLIVYATRSGATRAYARALAAELPGSRVHDLSQGAVDLGNADTVVIGSGVRMRRLHPRVRGFAAASLTTLLRRNVAVYLCGCYPDTHGRALEKGLPASLVEHAVCLTSLGGPPPFSPLDDAPGRISTPSLAALVDAVRALDPAGVDRATETTHPRDEERLDGA